MVIMNVEIGGNFNLVICCGVKPIITDYSENQTSWRVGYECSKCGSTGGYGMGKPQKKEVAENV